MEQPWTVVKKRSKANAEKREARYVSSSTVEGKARAKGANKLKAMEIADAEWEAWIKDTVTGMKADRATVCLMFYIGGGGDLKYHSDASGYPSEIKAKLKSLRQVSGVKADKASVCAEEQLLVDHDGNDYILSIAFDRYGKKTACQGCRVLLKHYEIKDMWRK